MATRERDRLKVVAALAERRLRRREAGRLVKLSERQVRRILARDRPTSCETASAYPCSIQ
ncbi:MAG TPA: hypothetical protein VMY35_04395 [Phycisphaerae bacterium]|nr:hypothetical protein [Phycisphaerae bacterium]